MMIEPHGQGTNLNRWKNDMRININGFSASQLREIKVASVSLSFN